MREWRELSSEEICKDLDLPATNLYVQLPRARLRKVIHRPAGGRRGRGQQEQQESSGAQQLDAEV